jgi:hypothetical protein
MKYIGDKSEMKNNFFPTDCILLHNQHITYYT